MAWGLFALFVATALLAQHERGDWYGAALIVGNITVGIYNIHKAFS